MFCSGVGLWFLCCAAVADVPVAETRATHNASSSSVVTGPAVAGVYRSRGANGEVEFNNFGNGERIELDVVPAPVGDEQARSSARVNDMLDVARALASDRQARTARREAQRESRILQAREEARLAAQHAEWLAATRPRYYPAFVPRHDRGRARGRLRQEWRTGAGPYRDGYRYANPPLAADPSGSVVSAQPQTKSKL